jgi:hypothetical protein
MVSFLTSAEKHIIDILYIVFKLYNNMIVHRWVYIDPYSNIGVVEAHLKLLKKVSMI